jgi:hypothetical protein
MTVTRHPAASVSWHLPAIAFFTAGLLAGIAFAVAAPIVAIRTLGGVAVLAALFGIATVSYAARLENPRLVEWLHAYWITLRAAMEARRREVTTRVGHADRYLQNVVWSAMG